MRAEPAVKIYHHFDENSRSLCGENGEAGKGVNCPRCLAALNIKTISLAEFIMACNACGIAPGKLMKGNSVVQMPPKVAEYLANKSKQAEKPLEKMAKIIQFPGPRQTLRSNGSDGI